MTQRSASSRPVSRAPVFGSTCCHSRTSLWKGPRRAAALDDDGATTAEDVAAATSMSYSYGSTFVRLGMGCVCVWGSKIRERFTDGTGFSIGPSKWVTCSIGILRQTLAEIAR